MEHVWGIPLLIFYLGVLTYFLFKWGHFQHESLSKKLVAIFFFYKIILGFALTMIYIYYYKVHKDADIFKYFDDSKEMTRALLEKPSDFFKMLFGIGNDSEYFSKEYYFKMNHWFRHFETQVYNDNHTMIRLNAVMRLFSFGYFHIHTIFMCFLSFFGMMSFYKGFALFTNKNKHHLLAYGLFLFPSLNFWSAGVLKEGLLIFALGNIFYVACLILYKKQNMFYLLLATFSLFIMLYLKSYALAAVGLGIIGLATGFLFKNNHIGWVYLGLTVFAIGILALFTYLFPEFNIPEIITQKQVDFTRFSIQMKSGSFFSIGELGGSWADLLRMSPYAFYTGLFRPTVLDVTNPMMLMSAFESLLFMLGIFLSVFFFKKPEKHQVNMLLSCIVIILVLCTIIGLATANFGSLVRYKVPAIPFIIFSCICLIDVDKIKLILFRKNTKSA
jgi:hypothetical protein